MNEKTSNRLVRYRFTLQGGYDAACWFLAVVSATLLRYDFNVSRFSVSRALVAAAVIAAAQVGVGRLAGLYIHRWRYGTFEEIVAAIRSVAILTVLAAVLNPILGRYVPVSVPVMAGALALCGMFAGRSVWRIVRDRSIRPSESRAERVLVFGAGEGGTQMLTSMLKNPASPYLPVALLDDSPDAQNLRVRGVPVVGDRTRIADAAAEYGATAIVIAIPSASSGLIRELVAIADSVGIRTMVLPSVSELLGQMPDVTHIRELTPSDLLGRHELNTDVESVAGYLTGRRVLVTGAGGSIGSELCRQIVRFAPASLVMLDRDESALQAVQVSIEGRGLLDSRDLVIASIRDRDRLEEVFEEHRPEVVFHAAALKHLPLLEMHPEEGFKTNVLGTLNMLEVSHRFDVATFVNISTDKAAEATSTLGRTKRLAERLTAHYAGIAKGTYLSVRFGNVLGSRGSVIPLFRAQIAQGGPVTVTDPEVTRFFMTIEEACQLVIQAGASSHSGEVLVLDMGEPVKIVDVARRMIAAADRPIEIVYTGLRPGEKMHEVLFGPDEVPAPSEHPLISRVAAPPLDPDNLNAFARDGRLVAINLTADRSDVGRS